MFDKDVILVYIQVISSILVFGVGVPSLLANSLGLKHIRLRRVKWGVMDHNFVAILISGFSLIFLIGYFIDPTPFIHYRNDSLFYKITESLQFYSNQIAGILTIINIIVVIVYWNTINTYQTQQILKILRSQSIRNRKRPLKLEGLINDIGYLGLHCTSESDKQEVLQILYDLMEFVPPDNELLNRQLLHSTLLTARSGGEENNIFVLKIINHIIASNKETASGDENILRMAIGTLEEISDQMIKFGSGRIFIEIYKIILLLELPAISFIYQWFNLLLLNRWNIECIKILTRIEQIYYSIHKISSYGKLVINGDSRDKEITGLYFGSLAKLFTQDALTRGLILERIERIETAKKDSCEKDLEVSIQYITNECGDLSTSKAIQSLLIEVIEYKKLKGYLRSFSGIGKMRAKTLAQNFKTFTDIQEAPNNKLIILGIPALTIQEIKNK